MCKHLVSSLVPKITITILIFALQPAPDPEYARRDTTQVHNLMYAHIDTLCDAHFWGDERRHPAWAPHSAWAPASASRRKRGEMRRPLLRPGTASGGCPPRDARKLAMATVTTTATPSGHSHGNEASCPTGALPSPPPSACGPQPNPRAPPPCQRQLVRSFARGTPLLPPSSPP